MALAPNLKRNHGLPALVVQPGHRQCAGQSGTTDFTDIDPTPALQEHGRRADGEVAPALGSDLERDLRRELAADRCVARSRVAGYARIIFTGHVAIVLCPPVR